MIIREATIDDAVQVAALWNLMIRDTLATFTTVEKTTAGIAGLIQEREGQFWVASQANKVLGFATYGPFRVGPGYAATVELTIILSSKVQGAGLGRKMVHQACIAAAEQDHHIMIAGISSANHPAMAFFSACGFVETARMPEVGRKQGHWLDLILMQKTLDRP